MNASEAFRSIDKDGNNRLSKQELIMALAKYGIDVSSQTVDAMLTICDNNGDGEISLAEFGKALQRDQAQSSQVFGLNDRYVTAGHVVTSGTGPQVLMNDNLGVMKRHQIGDRAIFKKHQLMHTNTVATKEQMTGYRKQIQDRIYSKFKRLTDAFRTMDFDHDGKLSKEEICQALADFNCAIPHEHAIQLIDELADTDADGSVDYNEFAAALKRDDKQQYDLIRH